MATTDTFGQFSPETQLILLKSQALAEERNQGVIGSEHLLLALLTVDQHSPARSVLADFLVDVGQAELVLQLEPAVDLGRTGRDGLTDEARRVLEQSALQAIHTRSPAIEPLHLLWAMVTDSATTAAGLLTKIGVTTDHLRNQLDQLFHEHLHVEHLIEQHLDLFELETDEGVVPAMGPITRSNRKQSVLETLTTDLTERAGKNELDPMIGRASELERLIHILLRRTKNNPVLIGEPGVGKTSIVEGLAARIAASRVPTALQGMVIRRLDVSSLVAGTMYRGQFEDRLGKLIAEITAHGRTILFIDEVHTVIGAGSAEGSLDAANILKPALTKGALRVIGATTLTEYQKHIERDAAFERRFQPLVVREPSVADTVAMLHGLRPKLEAHHQLTIDDAGLTLAAELAARYLPARRLPDSAIDVIDEAAATHQARLTPFTTSSAPPAHQGLDRQLKTLTKEKAFEIRRQNFERAAYLRDQELKLKLAVARQQPAAPVEPLSRQLPLATIRSTVAQLSGVPAQQLEPALLTATTVADRLARTIVGQSAALQRVGQAVARAHAGLRPPQQPRSVLLFAGPSGVGKTELAYALANELFGSRDALVRLDMSEFREPHTVARLLGAPPGYVGHDEAGRLTEAIRRRPAAVVLFDEIEKAHPDVLNLLLQLLDYGRLTDGKGRDVNFRSTHIVLTTNVGAEQWTKAGLGFKLGNDRSTDVQDAAKALFRPELQNRLDDIVVFQPLEAGAFVELAASRLKTLNERLAPHRVSVTVDRRAVKQLVMQVMVTHFGARALDRLIANQIEAPLLEKLSQEPSPYPRQFRLEHNHGSFELTSTRATATTPAL